MSKALDALHAHLKKQNRATPRTKENEIICRINRHMDLIILDLLKLSRHTQNRIAAHKAHTTMAKKQKFDWDKPISFRITKKGTQALHAKGAENRSAGLLPEREHQENATPHLTSPR